MSDKKFHGSGRTGKFASGQDPEKFRNIKVFRNPRLSEILIYLRIPFSQF